MSVRETIFAAIEAALGATGAQEIERMPSSDPLKFDALHIMDDGQAQIEGEAGATRYGMAISIEGYVEGSGGSAMHTRLNNLHASTVAAVLGLIGVVPAIEDIEEGDLRPAVAPLASKARLAFSQDFTITFATRRGQP
ncbi:hypothetical protein [Sphingobium sp. LF-16]|uniref:hypothetical protein n=1 Tax=Sphingobium sp. LF-16 TaxID=2185111 RepID=UPI000F07C5E3|nr:hypothetical protein [Sphingobium sp. LF-16]